MPTAQDIGKSANIVYKQHVEGDNNSDKAYSDDDEDQKKKEESKEFADRKREIEDTNLNNSDDQAYTESDEEKSGCDYRSDDDFEITSQDSEERNKAFYGDDYTILS